MGEPLLLVEHLVVRFDKHFAVGPFDLAVDRGVVHLRGANGSGKTTLLRAICGELSPSQGRVRVAGDDVHRVPSARRRIALAPSSPELPAFLSVREAFEFTAALRGAPAWDGRPYCEALALPVELPMAVASAGQRRKAELVCALAGDPDVLLLDETFAHLDQKSCAVLSTWIEAWGEHRVIVLTDHGATPMAAHRTVTLAD
ncbi:MAG: ATP-binding cassette domain-containing protein [Pseudomonadota bacterium]